MPETPLRNDDLRRKFMLLTADMGEANAAKLFDRLQNLEDSPVFSLA